MAIDLTKYLPRDVKNRDPILTKYITALSTVMNNAYVSMQEMKTFIDSETIDVRYLPLLLSGLGWLCKVPLTETQMRLLIPNVEYILRRRGTPEIIIFTIGLLFDIQLEIKPLPVNQWTYGVSKYGTETVYHYYSTKVDYQLVVAVSLTPEIVNYMYQIINYLRPYGVEYSIVGSSSNITLNKNKPVWLYSKSAYGTETIMMNRK